MLLDRLKGLLSPEVSINAKFLAVSLFFGKLLESHDSRIVDLEARQLQKGDKGDQGVAGKDGKDGKNGIDGLAGKDGRDGKAGKDGRDGKAGKNGISVVDAEIAADSHLVLKLSDGAIIDAGEMPSLMTDAIYNTQVARDQITVSVTAPSNPQVNDLWYDIS